MPSIFQPNFSPIDTTRSQFKFEPFPRNGNQTIPGLYGSIQPERDVLHLSHQKPKSGLLSKVLKGSALIGATVLGGVAFKRYAPNAASQVASYIPDLLKKPVNYTTQSSIGQKAGQAAESLLAHSEGWFGKAKDLVLNLLGKAAK